MHPETFLYLKPTDSQLQSMAEMREAFAECAARIEKHVPDGPDRTYVLRKLRECGMWSNVAITRQPDGAPRA